MQQTGKNVIKGVEHFKATNKGETYWIWSHTT